MPKGKINFKGKMFQAGRGREVGHMNFKQFRSSIQMSLQKCAWLWALAIEPDPPPRIPFLPKAQECSDLRCGLCLFKMLIQTEFLQFMVVLE